MQEADKALLKKFINKDYSAKELERILVILKDPESQSVLEELTQESWDTTSMDGDISKENRQQIKDILFSKITDGNLGRPIRPLFKLMRYAAIFIGGLSLFSLIWIKYHEEPKQSAENSLSKSEIIHPGTDKAILTLSDGSTVALEKGVNEKIKDESGIEMEMLNNGELVYNSNPHPLKTIAFNSIQTPNSGTYHITLPDGSQAWLNAASSLTYPVQFSSEERRVKMTGEVYFEISKKTNSKNERIPFIVESSKQEIQVLGTKFNLIAYPDEPFVKTTLVEGSVRVKSSLTGESILLEPGQQSVLASGLKIMEADIPKEMAWKNGKFIYKGESLASIFRQISRWYDVKVDCPESLKELKFSGVILRSTSLPELIKMIESTGEVKIQVKGRRLLVSE